MSWSPKDSEYRADEESYVSEVEPPANKQGSTPGRGRGKANVPKSLNLVNALQTLNPNSPASTKLWLPAENALLRILAVGYLGIGPINYDGKSS